MEVLQAQAHSDAPPEAGMIWIPDGTFRMGSGHHYAEEAPVHRVTVDGFWIDSTPVTNAEFRAASFSVDRIIERMQKSLSSVSQ